MNSNLASIEADVARALAEDIGSGDVTVQLLPADMRVEAEIISREAMVVCGQLWVEQACKQVDDAIELQWHVREGQWLDSAQSLCHIQGPARSILTVERTLLNFLQTLSATATQTYQYVQCLEGTKTRLLDTRKTVPGLRLAQKYAVHCGGGVNHRLGLYDAFLIKENHIKACGSIAAAISLARSSSDGLLVEVEVETIAELEQALAAKPDRILLDNFSLEMLAQAVALRGDLPCQLEASGGINLATITDVAKTGVDFISVGAITKSIAAIDLSLLVRDIL